VGANRAVAAARETRRATENDRFARCGGGDSVHGDEGLPVADAAEGFPADVDGSGLSLRLARQRLVAVSADVKLTRAADVKLAHL